MLVLEITSKHNCVSADVSDEAAHNFFESRECNLRQFLIFLSVTGALIYLEPTEMLGLLIDTGCT